MAGNSDAGRDDKLNFFMGPYHGFQYQGLLGLGHWVIALALGLNQAHRSIE